MSAEAQIKERIAALEDAIARAERRGPSHPGYVTDYTFYSWGGQKSGLREALRILEKESSP